MKERIIRFINYKGITTQAFELKTGLSNGAVSKMGDGTRRRTLEKISNCYPELNINWLLTGEGEMLTTPYAMTISNQGSGNAIGNNNRGNIGMGNVVNVSLPETGTQKIIKPDGEVRVVTTESNASTSDELKDLKTEIQHLNAIITMKDDLIANLKTSMAIKDDLITSLKETIEILKSRQ